MSLTRHPTRSLSAVSMLSLLATLLLVTHMPGRSEERARIISSSTRNSGLVAQDVSREKLKEAERLAGNGDTEGAIRILKSLVESGHASVEVLARLGELYGGRKEYDAAIAAYRQAIKLAGGEAGNNPVNIRMQLGAALFLSKNFKEAIPEIEAGLTHRSRTLEDFLPYKMLALAYEFTGANAEARQANKAVLAAYPASPDAWAALARLGPPVAGTETQPLRAGVPSPPALDEFTEVFSLGDPLKWAIRDLEKAFQVYTRYAEALEKMGRILSAGNVRRIAAMMSIKVMDDSLTAKHPEDAVRAFSMIDRVGVLDKLAVALQRQALFDLIVAHGDLGQYVHGIAAAERLLGLTVPSEKRDADIQLIVRFLTEVFDSVSWDKSKQLRTNDVDDFSDLNNLRTAGREGRKGGGQRTATTQNVIPGTHMPYGMVSPDEDSATIAQNMPTKAFRELIALRIKQGNFELPVKSLLSQIIEPYKFRVLAAAGGLSELGVKDMSLEQLEASQLSAISEQFLKELDEAILKADPEKIPETTLDAYTVARRALLLLKGQYK